MDVGRIQQVIDKNVDSYIESHIHQRLAIGSKSVKKKCRKKTSMILRAGCFSILWTSIEHKVNVCRVKKPKHGWSWYSDHPKTVDLEQVKILTL